MSHEARPIEDAHLDVEILIGRIVDGEAGDDDRQRFELLSARDPELWRRLAARQQDMLMLIERVEEETRSIDRIDVPAFAPQRFTRWSGLRSAAVWSGWAAALALALFWGMGSLIDHEPLAATQPVMIEQSLSPAQHLDRYLTAPFVLGEMQPTLMEVEQLPDGRYAASYLRRIVEVAFFDSPEELSLDEEGNFARDPETLRDEQPREAEPRATPE